MHAAWAAPSRARSLRALPSGSWVGLGPAIHAPEARLLTNGRHYPFRRARSWTTPTTVGLCGSASSGRPDDRMIDGSST
jgi:hypothetical protein